MWSKRIVVNSVEFDLWEVCVFVEDVSMSG